MPESAPLESTGTVFVVDAKHYRGEVKRREIGPLFRREPRLFVGRRDRAKLVVEARRQAEAVQRRLEAGRRPKGGTGTSARKVSDAERRRPLDGRWPTAEIGRDLPQSV